MVKMIPSPKGLCQFNTQEKEWKAGFPQSEEHCVLYSSVEGRMIPTSGVKINRTFYRGKVLRVTRNMTQELVPE